MSAGLGALLALQITDTPVTATAFGGIILLIGIVKKMRRFVGTSSFCLRPQNRVRFVISDMRTIAGSPSPVELCVSAGCFAL